jgi:hypothetical protein
VITMKRSITAVPVVAVMPPPPPLLEVDTLRRTLAIAKTPMDRSGLLGRRKTSDSRKCRLQSIR